MKALIVLLAAVASLAPFAPPAGPVPSSDEVLENGLRVVLLPHHANPMVASAVVVGAGVAQEPATASGASHFLEHLLFNGTATRTQRQLYDDVDRLGAYNNATTREDHTLFTFLVAKELAEQGLAIQAEMLFGSTIPEETFDKERNIVLEELARDRTDPAYDRETAFRSWAYAGTPIARPVLGTDTSLQAISRAQVVAYYRAHYVPSNMTLVVMGDFEIPTMRAIVRKTFGAAPKAARPASPAGAWPPAPKNNLVAVASAAASGPQHLLAAFPIDVDPWDRTAAAAEALLAAASEGDDAPFQRALLRRGVKPQAVTLALEPRLRPWSTVTADVEVPDGADPRLVLDAMAEALDATGPAGAARDRLERVLTQQRADAAIARDQIHYFVMLRSATVLGAPEGSLGRAAALWDALTPEDWDAASVKLRAGMKEVRARSTGPKVADSAGTWRAPEAFAPPSRSALRAGVLANGLRYVVRASDDSDVFAMHVITAPRAAAEPAGLYGITDLLHRVMLRGTIIRDAAGLQDQLARTGARIKAYDDPAVPFDDYYTTSEFAWVRLEVPAAHWRDGVSLVGEIVRFPALTEEGLTTARREMQDLVARASGSPRAVATARLDELLAPQLPVSRPVIGTQATLDAISLEALRSYHRASAVGRRTIVTVVSSIDVDEVVRVLDSDFGGMPAGDAIESAAPVPIGTSLGSADLTLGKSQAYVAMGDLQDVAPGDRAATAVAVAMLSDRLAFDLRETKGLAYAVAAQARPWGGRMRFDLSIGTRPENLEAVQSGLVEGARAFRDAAPTAADVERAVHTVRGAALMRRMTRISLAYEAGIEVLRGREPGDERRFVDSLPSVSAGDVHRAATAYLDPARLARVSVR